MNGLTKNSIKRLRDKGLSDEEIAHVFGCDIGRVKIVFQNGDDPELVDKPDNLSHKKTGSRSPAFGKWGGE